MSSTRALRGAQDRMERREFLRGVGGVALGSWTAGCERRTSRTEPRPNVLFLMADQLRWDALSVNGNRIVSTPNLDRLASRAVNFRQAICAAPLCGPSRAGMLTGNLVRRHGCRGNSDLESVTGIAPEVPTFDELLKAAGYTCEYHGKWHTGATHQEAYAVGPGDFLGAYRDEMLAKHGRPEDSTSADWKVDSFTKLPYRPFEADRLMRAAQGKGVRFPHRSEVG